jgi:hypothetical protein
VSGGQTDRRRGLLQGAVAGEHGPQDGVGRSQLGGIDALAELAASLRR